MVRIKIQAWVSFPIVGTSSYRWENHPNKSLEWDCSPTLGLFTFPQEVYPSW